SFSCTRSPLPRRSTLLPYTTLFRSLGASVPLLGVGLCSTGQVGGGLGQVAHLHTARDPSVCGRDARLGQQAHGRLETVARRDGRSEEHTSELQSRENLVCRLLLAKK